MATAEMKLDLSGVKSWEDSPFRRPRITLGIGDDGEPFHAHCPIWMHLEQQMGQPDRWVEMNANEARQFAAQLLALADLIDFSSMPREVIENSLIGKIDAT